jgi:hypothetical protein
MPTALVVNTWRRMCWVHATVHSLPWAPPPTTWRRSLEARSRFKPYNRRRTPARHWKYLATSWHPLDGGVRFTGWAVWANLIRRLSTRVMASHLGRDRRLAGPPKSRGVACLPPGGGGGRAVRHRTGSSICEPEADPGGCHESALGPWGSGLVHRRPASCAWSYPASRSGATDFSGRFTTRS